MQIVEHTGDVFELAAKHGAFAHGVNCRGVMGKGVALDVRRTWPTMYDRYKHLCANNTLRPGMIWPWHDPASNTRVYNLATQDRPGANAKTAYITSCVEKMVAHASGNNIRNIATVRLGCGIGGLNWDDVRAAIDTIDTDITLHVATLPPPTR